MKLIIYQNYEEEYILKLIKLIQQYILNHLDTKKLKNFDDFFSTISSKSIYLKYLNSKSIITAGVYNIEYIKYPSKVEIRINPNTNLYGSNYKIQDLCKLINYGNLVVKGYPIFSEAFEHFRKHLDQYYILYKNGIIK